MESNREGGHLAVVDRPERADHRLRAGGEKGSREARNALHRQGRRFDVVISDPPRLARERRGVPKALRMYRDLHLRALRVVRPGGLLAVSSCSGSVGDLDFEETLKEAAYDVGREIQVLYRGGQAADHPVLATCPEGRYLKFLLACVS